MFGSFIHGRDRLQQQIDLKIQYDWSKIRDYYNILIKNMSENKFDKYAKEYPDEENGLATYYSIGNHGCIIHNDGLSKDWNIWTGKMLESMVPWIPEAKGLFKNLKLDSIKFGSITTSVKKHRDGGVNSEPMCNLTYIISSADPNARTISYDNNDPRITKVISSTPGTAYLLDTQTPHEIISEGFREVFQFCFKNDFDILVDQLNNIGPIRLEG